MYAYPTRQSRSQARQNRWQFEARTYTHTHAPRNAAQRVVKQDAPRAHARDRKKDVTDALTYKLPRNETSRERSKWASISVRLPARPYTITPIDIDIDFSRQAPRRKGRPADCKAIQDTNCDAR
mmetsp:Transcript_12450/g.33597  ORF Transcript_12450/g.33597 Transcript_12450/m.33597 type:complete len:124 (-) Transcript_12450:808-1179(-)